MGLVIENRKSLDTFFRPLFLFLSDLVTAFLSIVPTNCDSVYEPITLRNVKDLGKAGLLKLNSREPRGCAKVVGGDLQIEPLSYP